MKKKHHQPADFIRETVSRRSFSPWFINLGYGLLGMVLLIVFWQAVGMLVFSIPGYEQFSAFLPGPAFKALLQLFASEAFWQSAAASLRRVAIGLFFAFLFGFSWGVVRGFFDKIEKISHMPIQFVRMISPLSWMPIAIFLLPSFEYAIYFLLTMASVWPIMTNTTQGIRAVDPSWINMAYVQGATKWQVLTKVMLPSALPDILNGLRLALGITWIILVPAEYLGVNNGLGYLINDARDTLEYDRLMALVIAIGIIGFLLDGVFRYLGKRFNWRERRN